MFGTFSKKDLKPGMLCEIRDGRLCLVLPEKNGELTLWADKERCCQISTNSMTDDMQECVGYHEYDVMKVYGDFMGGNPFSKESYTLLWEREPELKPCPFCNSAKFLNVVDAAAGYCVLCDTSRGGCGSSSGLRDSEWEAIELWNRRAE